jgi:hypothetical protein
MKVIQVSTLAMSLMCFSQNVGAQIAPEKHPVTDTENIAEASAAAPDFIATNATILDWPAKPGGEFRVLRTGTSEWSCVPSTPPGYPHAEPGCYDKVFTQFIVDSLAGRTPRISTIGISYMYQGEFVRKPGETDLSKPEFHVWPHIMIVSPNQDELEAFSRDGTTGMPYVAHLPNRKELFLVIPIQQWNEKR